jgi:hypothetical protein
MLISHDYVPTTGQEATNALLHSAVSVGSISIWLLARVHAVTPERDPLGEADRKRHDRP